jgi:hypothetical protein
MIKGKLGVTVKCLISRCGDVQHGCNGSKAEVGVEGKSWGGKRAECGGWDERGRVG